MLGTPSKKIDNAALMPCDTCLNCDNCNSLNCCQTSPLQTASVSQYAQLLEVNGSQCKSCRPCAAGVVVVLFLLLPCASVVKLQLLCNFRVTWSTANSCILVSALFSRPAKLSNCCKLSASTRASALHPVHPFS